MTISTEKTKAFCGWEPTKRNIIEQINALNYLGSYEAEKDIDDKLSEFLKVTGLINMIFKPSKL